MGDTDTTPDPVQANPGTTRRGFLKTAALGTLATVGATALSACSEKADPAGGDPTEPAWDEVFDVVVVGSGTGLVAALAAASAGAKVLVLEKSAEVGGSTKMSGGVAWIPNNPVMKAAGTDDTREAAITYLKKLALDQAEDTLIEAFVDQGPAMVTFVEGKVSWKWRVSTLVGDYHTEWPGAVKMGRSIEPDVPGFMNFGTQMIEGLATACTAAGAELRVEAPAKRLVTRLADDGSPEVLGVVATVGGKDVRIQATLGVILAAGGYDWNFEMKRTFLRGPSKLTIGHPGNTGDGIVMAMAIGAGLWNMNEAWGGTVYKAETESFAQQNSPGTLNAMIQRRMPGCITVNRHGQRFCNEASDYDSAWRTFFAWENWGDAGNRNLPAYQISDGNGMPQATVGVVQADTIKELATKLGIDPDALDKTVNEFNDNCYNLDADPVFHRGESAYDNEYGPALGPLEATPYYGVEVAPADLGTAGGVRVNANAQALTPFGKVIKGLYASGNNSGVGGPGAGYGGGGGTIGPAMVFAYIAGTHVTTPAAT